MAKKKVVWSTLHNTNLKTSIRHFRSISSDLGDFAEDIEKILGDESLAISSDDMASLIVSIRNASSLLQVIVSAKQLQELKEENEKLRTK
jgi:mevalonate kinase